MLLQRVIESVDRRNDRQLFTVVENFELHLRRDLAAADSAGALSKTAMSPNERKVSQRGRHGPVSSITRDQGDQRRHAFAIKRRCTRASGRTSPLPLAILMDSGR